MKWYALADSNNFYASCERSFAPQLRNQAIVVLSNNDGCVVARSNEAKAIGIPMGIPVWKIQKIIKEHKVHVFSSNYALYGDMSNRVINILQANCSDIEVYSIDESFLEFTDTYLSKNQMIQQCQNLRQLVLKATGIPISIGIAPTKTLSKLANYLAKRKGTKGVFILTADAPILAQLAVNKIWGVAKGYERRLAKFGVKTIAGFCQLSEVSIRKEFGVVGVRMHRELRGIPSYTLDEIPSKRKSMVVSRSFSKDVYELQELKEAVSVYATRLAEKLRYYKQHTQLLRVFLKTNPYRQKHIGQRYFTITVDLPLATSNTNELIQYATEIVDRLYKKGLNYKKAGVMADRLTVDNQLQANLFQSTQQHFKNEKLMKSIDTINAINGRNTVYFASCGQQQSWARKEQFRSPKYTTKWSDILTIKI